MFLAHEHHNRSHHHGAIITTITIIIIIIDAVCLSDAVSPISGLTVTVINKTRSVISTFVLLLS